MNKENIFLKIINETLSDNSYLGDDCAYLKDLDLIISEDTLVEDVHFKLSYYTPYELGKKALLVNVSDILAGGGEPKYALISLSGKLDENFIKEFYKGIDEICGKYKIKILGGDLVGGDKITVSICILGNTKRRFISSRKNARPEDLVYLKGFHGSAAKGLELLLGGEKDKNNEFIKAHIEPSLFLETSETISKNIETYAMMDTSDGLYDALYKISNESNVGFEICYDKIPKKIDDKNMVLFGGEDFGLLICINPKYACFMKDAALIGKVTDTKKIIIDEIEIREDKSFSHFS